MIDDGPWGGVPIGGIGAGSIGRTQRGDFARWHLRVGEHRFASEPLDGFAVWADDGTGPRAVVLRTTQPPPGWGSPLAVGTGTYHALFPRAWFEYELPGLAVRLVEEQLTPVLPGDDAAASLPVGVFEFTIENPVDREVDVAVMLSWRDALRQTLRGSDAEAHAGATDAVVSAAPFHEEAVAGVRFRAAADGPSIGGTLAIAAETRPGLEVTTVAFDADDPSAAWAGFAADGRVGSVRNAGPDQRPGGDTPADPGGAVAVRLRVAPGARETVRFSIAWDVPLVVFGGGRRWRKRYTREWGVTGERAVELAGAALAAAPAWRRAIEAWQAPILDSEHRPAWYKAALFNELYLLVDGGTLWHDGPAHVPGLPGVSGPGDLAILECYDYPFYDTLDVHFYAAFALTSLWPHLQVSISRAYAATVCAEDATEVAIEASGETAVRKVRGALPHDLGGPGEDPLVRPNHYRFQAVNGWKDLNPKFVLQAWRDRTWAADQDAYLGEVWPSIAPAMDHVAAFDRDGDGLPEHDGRPDQTYDTWPMTGPSAYGGGLWLAALRAASAFARAVGEQARADRWGRAFERAAASYVSRLWNGSSFDYDDGGTPMSDSVMADQLVGQWYADVSGLGDLVPATHVESSLRRVYRLNVQGFGDGRMGAVNGVRPDGSVDVSSEQSQEVWTGTSYALASFMIGRGLVDEGWTTAEGVARVTYEQGLWFRTPEAYDRDGNFRASIYLRPLAIWAIEEALGRREAALRGSP